MAMKPGDRRIPVRVTSVTDGDSLRVRRIRRWRSEAPETEVRLFAMDAPELGQRYSVESRSHLVRIAQERLFLDVIDIDQYGRTVAVVYRRRPTDSLNLEMVRAGWARYYSQYDIANYAGGKLGLAKAENRAEARKRGIWQDPKYNLAPWEYRRMQRTGSAPDRRRFRRAGLSRFGCVGALTAAALIGLGLVALLLIRFLTNPF